MNAIELFKLKWNHEPYVGEWFHCKVKNVFSKCCYCLFFVFKFQTIFSVEVSRRLVCDDDDDDDDELYSCVDVFS